MIINELNDTAPPLHQDARRSRRQPQTERAAEPRVRPGRVPSLVRRASTSADARAPRSTAGDPRRNAPRRDPHR